MFSWVLWTDTLPKLDIPAGSQFSDIIIPTKDSARYTFLLDTALQHGHPMLFVGPTGTGKSVYINRHLVSTLPKEQWIPVFVTFSARTTANMTQDQVCAMYASTLHTPMRGMYALDPGFILIPCSVSPIP